MAIPLPFLACSSKALKTQSKDVEINKKSLDLQLHELQLSREESVKANHQRSQFEVAVNLRLLCENIEARQSSSGEFVEEWILSPRNEIIKVNLSSLIQYALEPLVKLSRSKKILLSTFSQEVIDENKYLFNNHEFLQKSFFGIKVEFANFIGSKLSSSDFGSAKIISSKFDFCELQESTFRFSNLANAQFIGANLSNCNFLVQYWGAHVFLRQT
ncbi:MAG: pentapeptide repeat-containing protein [Bacteroidetes bacterium]|nr:pentapeptide repeat-containing protein [Bacteroidota bacterium]